MVEFQVGDCVRFKQSEWWFADRFDFPRTGLTIRCISDLSTANFLETPSHKYAYLHRLEHENGPW